MGARLFALAFATCALAAPAGAADKVRLERLDLRGSPTVKLYVSLVDGDGRVLTGRTKEDFRLLIEDADQGPATQLQLFEEVKEPVNVVVVAQLGSAMSAVFEEEKRAIGALFAALPPKSKAALLGYSGETRRLSELVDPTEAESAAKLMVVDPELPEMRMLGAVNTGLDLLHAAAPGERKLLVLFSDGTDADMDARRFAAAGKKAHELGVVIDTIGYSEFDATKLRTLSVLATKSGGSDRACKTASDIANHFSNVAEEVRRQYVATFEVLLAGGDNRERTFQALLPRGDRSSNSLVGKLPKASHPVARPPSEKKEGAWWSWILLGIGGVCVVGLIVWRATRSAPAELYVPAPEPLAPPPPSRTVLPARTVALDGAGGGNLMVGWIMATSGRQAQQTFKLKPSRTVIGTGGDCDIRIDDQFMSSRHCEVRFERGLYHLVDLDSTNGVVVNERKVRSHDLVDNDNFCLGRTEFKFKSIG